MEAYRSYFRRTGDLRKVAAMQPYRDDAQAAYSQFVDRGDAQNAARSLILAADIERMLVMEDVP